MDGNWVGFFFFFSGSPNILLTSLSLLFSTVPAADLSMSTTPTLLPFIMTITFILQMARTHLELQSWLKPSDT